jgi:ferric iron reductase protein FhuF
MRKLHYFLIFHAALIVVSYYSQWYFSLTVNSIIFVLLYTGDLLTDDFLERVHNAITAVEATKKGP